MVLAGLLICGEHAMLLLVLRLCAPRALNVADRPEPDIQEPQSCLLHHIRPISPICSVDLALLLGCNCLVAACWSDFPFGS